jgi:hypothetical protein
MQLKSHAVATPWQVGEGARIVAVDAASRHITHRALSYSPYRGNGQRDLVPCFIQLLSIKLKMG